MVERGFELKAQGLAFELEAKKVLTLKNMLDVMLEQSETSVDEKKLIDAGWEKAPTDNTFRVSLARLNDHLEPLNLRVYALFGRGEYYLGNLMKPGDQVVVAREKVRKAVEDRSGFEWVASLTEIGTVNDQGRVMFPVSPTGEALLLEFVEKFSGDSWISNDDALEIARRIGGKTNEALRTSMHKLRGALPTGWSLIFERRNDMPGWCLLKHAPPKVR